MKRATIFAAALLAALPLVKAQNPSPKPAPAARAEVVFVSPDKYADVRDSYTSSDSGRDAILDELKKYMLEEADRFIPEGNKLSISVTDVDMAGDFEPWRGPRWDDVRVVKEIYPPRVDLSFKVTDASGKVIKEGTRQLRDMSFMMRLPVGFRDDHLKYEKTLLDDWFRSEFNDLKRK